MTDFAKAQLLASKTTLVAGMQYTKRYFRLFGFGIKLALLLLGLAVPVGLWVWGVFVFIPRIEHWSLFSTPPVFIVGLYPTKEVARQVRDERQGHTLYEGTTDDKRTVYILTDREISESHTDSLENALGGWLEQHSKIVADLPGLLEQQLPEFDRKVVDRQVNDLGRVTQVVVAVAMSVFCFALYFPLGGAVFNLFRHSRVT